MQDIRMEKAFISYLNDDNQTINGYFEITDINGFMIKFKSDNNLITIPLARVLKIKEKLKEDEDGKRLRS